MIINAKANINEICEAFQIESTKAHLIVLICTGKANLQLEEFESVQKRIKECYHKPNTLDLQMEALNELIDGFGVEAVNHELAWDRYWGNAIALYVNTGDTYSPTILYSIEDKRFELTTWGDFYESFEQGLETD